MHELSVATELYLGLRAELEARGGARLVSARIEVGELAAIEPRLLSFAWEAVVQGGPDEGALLDIEWRPVTCTCPHCGIVQTEPNHDWLRLCPHCAAPLRLEGGRELDVVSLVFEEATYEPPCIPA